MTTLTIVIDDTLTTEQQQALTAQILATIAANFVGTSVVTDWD